MARIFWDTNLFIYFFEENPQRGEKVTALMQRMVERQDQLFTSSLTVGEILVYPIRVQRSELVRRYLEFFNSGAVTVLPFDLEAAAIFARIRQQQSVSPPDAIQLACAAAAKVNLFLTNDERLSRLNVAGIDFITSLDRAMI